MSTDVDDRPAGRARLTLWRVTDRRTFEALRRDGHRARRGPLTVTWLPAAPGVPTPPRAAFAIGRNVGGAALRNRIRRRLRAALRELLAGGRLPAGTYLLGGGRELATMPWAELVELVGAAIQDARS